MSQTIRPEPILTEAWEVKYTRAPWSSRERRHTTARMNVPHHVIVGTSGRGATIEEARIDCLLKQAVGYVDAEDCEEDPTISDETLALLAKTIRREQNRRASAGEGTDSMTWTGTLSDEECGILTQALRVATQDANHYGEYGGDSDNVDEYRRLEKLFTDPARWAEEGMT